jgi:hypothetical protein
MQISFRSSMSVMAVAWLGCATQAFAQKPTVDTLKQVLDKKLQKLKPESAKERNVLFQDVKAGQGNNFVVTALIRDYEAGYPANRYYGQTCVKKIDAYTYTLAPDGAGGWDVEGRMTPDLSTQKCMPNPSAGVSSIPLSSLSGTAAPGGPVAAAPAVQRAGGVAVGTYECWSNGQARMLWNFKITGAGSYTGSDGKAGAFALDGGTQRIAFRGGSLDNAFGPGYYTVYYEPSGRPTVSIRPDRAGSVEAGFCQKVN